MKLGTQVGLGPGHIVLDGDPAPPLPKGKSPPIFGPYLLRPNGCMDQDVTWYGARPRPRRLCVRQGPSSPSRKSRQRHPPQFSAHFYPGQTAECIKMPVGMEVGLSPGDFALDGNPAPASPQKGGGLLSPPNFWPLSIAAKRLHGSRCHLVRRYSPRPSRDCARWRPSSPPQKWGRASPNFRPIFCGQRAGSIKVPLGMEVGLSPGDFVLDGG